jgi:hypothetical protein
MLSLVMTEVERMASYRQHPQARQVGRPASPVGDVEVSTELID